MMEEMRMNNEEWINRALEKASKLEEGTTFMLKSLFEGVEWEKETAQDRRELGRWFSNKCKDKTIGIKFLYNKGNGNVYMKEREKAK